MMDLTIQEIARACGGKLVVQGGREENDGRVSSVVIDSRAVEPGGVFIATVGERVDGHSFISAAFAKGAALAVTQKGPDQVGEAGEGWGDYVLVEDTLQALKDIAEAYRRKLPVKVIGITGSVGKTSTKEFIAAVLAEKYRVLKTEGNFNNEIGVPLTLLRIRGEHELAVVEMGISDFGEMHRLSKMARPDVCVMTNIGQSHLNNLKDRDGILRAKSEIFDYMAVDGEICLNGEDDKLAEGFGAAMPRC
ncbi:MAG: UDP-N-acetylmuramoyl-tripeptide--D-alanyl-D-alanine ligase [Lachnospiraceae bacterium]|nr:UDP-N-acetylmuramoyl-tripeptide--D-alanyl-D-alanine ligase [Lachnospiraceae bacterium]